MDVLLAEVALEVASHLKDQDMTVSRAEWRHMVIAKAQEIIKKAEIEPGIDDDIDEIVGWFMGVIP